MADGQIFYATTYGGPKVMKGLADIISRDDRWKAILYIRELQKAASKPAAPAAAAAPAAPASPGAKP
jgi:hypothetical protein